jgi:succinyl-CoA synthetase beta subunit
MTDPAIEAARAEGRAVLTEPEAKSMLERAGLSVPAHRLVDTPEAAVEAAESLGFPVVVKVVSPSVQHKSEWGDGAGVTVGLEEPPTLHEAAQRIADRLTATGTEGRILVEAAADVEAGTELLLGGTRHRSFGPTVTLGLGGIYAEVFEDVAHRLAPVEPAEVRGMLGEFDGARLLEGVRGRPAADTDAVIEAVVAVGDLVADEPAIAEVDVNPLLATGDDVLVLDGLVLLDGAD